MARYQAGAEWVALQRKIFSRWIASGLAHDDVYIKDCVTELSGFNLATLVARLSESEFAKMHKIRKDSKLKAVKLDAAELALEFVAEQGVEMKVEPSPSNVVDGDENLMLGLVWALMRKFIRFSDDDDGMSPQDALLMWVNNKVVGYGLPVATKFDAVFHDGRILAAIIHKHRPSLIDAPSLAPNDGTQNLAKVFEAAEKYFDLEQFITPLELTKLDEKSMFIYVSEFFNGVARQRKYELAARRITKLVDYTRENDRMKAEFNDKAQALRAHISKVEIVLNNREIDNTMSGAVKKLEDFYGYKEHDKSQIAGQYLDTEAFYNHLAMRLSDHNRPPYAAPAELSLEGLGEALKQLEKTEQERSEALHQELNRQHKLVQENGQHQRIWDALSAWKDSATTYLEEREEITTVGGANYHLNKLKAWEDEFSEINLSNTAALKKISSTLEEEKYENLDQPKSREDAIAAQFIILAQLSAEKLKVLQDHLAREQFNAKLRIDDAQHITQCTNIDTFNAAKIAYLTTKETVTSVPEAQAALGILDACKLEIEEFNTANVPGLKTFGAAIKARKYETKYSSSAYEFSDALDARESAVDAIFIALGAAHAAKLDILEDDRDREIFSAQTRLLNDKHVQSTQALNVWCDEKAAYLNTKEIIESISDAELHLSRLEASDGDKKDKYEHEVGNLKKLGEIIREARYEKLTQWRFETPADVSAREIGIDARFDEIAQLHAAKKATLEDDLAREQFKAKVLQWNDQHKNATAALSAWSDTSAAYLEQKEEINSIADAELEISHLAAYDASQANQVKNTVASLKALGQRILTAKYEHLSTYTFETPDEITGRESWTDSRFGELTIKSAAKSAVLADALDLEQQKEAKRLEYAKVTAEFNRFVRQTSEIAANTHFGFTLAEVEGFIAELDAQDAASESESASKQDKAKWVLDEGIALGVTTNIYTEETTASLQATHGKLAEALAARRSAYADELARQQFNDKLCKDFATKIQTFSDGLTVQRAAIRESTAELAVQLINVKQLSESKDQEYSIPPIEALSQQIEERGVTNNIHTFLTSKDAHVLLSQYKSFLTRKATMLAEEIELKKMRGLSPEQYNEIEAQFQQFDADNSGILDEHEVKACLFSLGEDKGKKEVQAIMKEFGEDGKDGLDSEGFTEFMIAILGDTGTKEEITNGFKLIMRGVIGNSERLADLMKSDDLTFITNTAPAIDDGWDYEAWTTEVFSR